MTFDAGSFQSLDLDVMSGTVEVRHVSGGSVRVIESGRVAKGVSAFYGALISTAGKATCTPPHLSLIHI